MIRKSITIVLLVVILFDAGGLIFGVQLRQWIHKASIAVIINAEKRPAAIITMTMKRSKFDEIKVHEGEFRLDGQMYDVVWRESNGDELTLYCFRDHDEEKMAAKFLRFLANKTSENSQATHSYSHNPLIGFTLSLPEIGFSFPSFSSREIDLFSLNGQTISRRRLVELPPPRDMDV